MFHLDPREDETYSIAEKGEGRKFKTLRLEKQEFHARSGMMDKEGKDRRSGNHQRLGRAISMITSSSRERHSQRLVPAQAMGDN